MTGTGISFIVLGLFLSIILTLYCRTSVCVWLFLLHLGAAFVLWDFTLTRAADSWYYYTSALTWSDFEFGTSAIAWLTTVLKESLEASYIDMYMIFHLAGYGGLVILYRLFQDVFVDDRSWFRGRNGLVHTAIFLPSLHVWTSGVGKDSLIFFGIACCVWASFNPRARLKSLAVGLVLCLLIRPHIFGLLLMSGALAIAIDQRVALTSRIMIVAVLAFTLLAAMPVIMDFVGLQSTDSGSLTSYIERRQSLNLEGGSSVDISKYSFPMQFFTYMYRPLFFDAAGAMAMLISVENLFYLIATWFILSGGWKVLRAGDQAFFLRFNLIFWIVSTSVFATVTSNLGIAMRQKTMMLPSFLVVVFAGYGLRERSAAKVVNATKWAAV